MIHSTGWIWATTLYDRITCGWLSVPSMPAHVVPDQDQDHRLQWGGASALPQAPFAQSETLPGELFGESHHYLSYTWIAPTASIGPEGFCQVGEMVEDESGTCVSTWSPRS